MSKKHLHISLVILAGFLMLAYQNCAPMKFSNSEDNKLNGGPDVVIDDPGIGGGDDNPPSEDDDNDDSDNGGDDNAGGGNDNDGDDNAGGGDDNDNGGGDNDGGGDDGSEHTSDAYCENALDGKTQITYASIADTNSPAVVFKGQDLKVPVKAENISFAGNGSYDSISVTARNLEEIGSLSAKSIYLNAVNIGHFGNFSVGELIAVTDTLEEASHLSGTLCLSAHNISRIKSLSTKSSIYGVSKNGVKAKLGSFSSASAFISFHNLEIGEMHNGSLRGRIENSTVKKLYSGAGVIYLVNSKIESIENFSGTIYLIGNSSIGSQKNSALKIVK